MLLAIRIILSTILGVQLDLIEVSFYREFGCDIMGSYKFCDCGLFNLLNELDLIATQRRRQYSGHEYEIIKDTRDLLSYVNCVKSTFTNYF